MSGEKNYSKRGWILGLIALSVMLCFEVADRDIVLLDLLQPLLEHWAIIVMTICGPGIFFFAIWKFIEVQNHKVVTSSLLAFFFWISAFAAGYFLANYDQNSASAVYDGKPDFQTYCQDRWDGSLVVQRGEYKCANADGLQTIVLEDVCKTQFGSEDYRPDPGTLEILCDTSRSGDAQDI